MPVADGGGDVETVRDASLERGADFLVAATIGGHGAFSLPSP